MKSVKAKVYTEKYFLTDCEGYREWRQTQGRKLSPRLKYAFEIAKIKKGERVLDFGCGRGEMVVQAMMEGAEVTGIDYSTQAVKLAQETLTKYKNSGIKDDKRGSVRVLLVNGKKLPLKDNSFDVVFLLDVVEHLYPQELVLALKEIRRVLRPGGRLIIHTAPNKLWPDVGYKYYSRWVNWIASKLIWEPVYKTRLMYKPDLRNEWDWKVHVNEQTTNSLSSSLSLSGFEKFSVWLDSGFRRTTKGFWFQFAILQPIWIPFLRRYFQMDIWGVVNK